MATRGGLTRREFLKHTSAGFGARAFTIYYLPFTIYDPRLLSAGTGLILNIGTL